MSDRIERKILNAGSRHHRPQRTQLIRCSAANGDVRRWIGVLLDGVRLHPGNAHVEHIVVGVDQLSVRIRSVGVWSAHREVQVILAVLGFSIEAQCHHGRCVEDGYEAISFVVDPFVAVERDGLVQ